MLYSYFFNMLKVGVPGFTQVPQLLVYNLLKFPQHEIRLAGVQPKLYSEHLRVLCVLLAYPVPQGSAAVIAVDNADAVRTGAAAKLRVDHDLCLIQRHAMYVKFNYAFGHRRLLICHAPRRRTAHNTSIIFETDCTCQ